MKMGRLEEAKTYLHKAEAVDRDYILTQLTLAELYAQAQETTQPCWNMRGWSLRASDR